MDRLIAANSVPMAQADTAPATGTPQGATDGNPATNVPATRWPSYQYNAIQEELVAILTAANVTPDRTNNAQIVAAIRALIAQSAAVIGDRRNLTMSVTAASANATLNADEIVVGSALGGQKYVLSSFSKTINLAGTGAGGMDTGSAPVSGFVALYAIYNPTKAAQHASDPVTYPDNGMALLATNATSVVVPNVYGGANMPSGYTASGLVSVWPTNGSSQFIVGLQQDRSLRITSSPVLNTTSSAGSVTALSISSAVPQNAKSASIRASISSSSAGTSGSMNVGATSSLIGAQTCSMTSSLANAPGIMSMPDIPIPSGSQQVFYNSAITGGTPTYVLQVYEYKI